LPPEAAHGGGFGGGEAALGGEVADGLVEDGLDFVEGLFVRVEDEFGLFELELDGVGAVFDLRG
jgi:hypothetical protein